MRHVGIIVFASVRKDLLPHFMLESMFFVSVRQDLLPHFMLESLVFATALALVFRPPELVFPSLRNLVPRRPALQTLCSFSRAFRAPSSAIVKPPELVFPSRRRARARARVFARICCLISCWNRCFRWCSQGFAASFHVGIVCFRHSFGANFRAPKARFPEPPELNFPTACATNPPMFVFPSLQSSF